MVGWHHQLNGHELGQALGVGEGQGSLVCCSPWCRRVGHNWMTEQQKENETLSSRTRTDWFSKSTPSTTGIPASSWISQEKVILENKQDRWLGSKFIWKDNSKTWHTRFLCFLKWTQCNGGKGRMSIFLELRCVVRKGCKGQVSLPTQLNTESELPGLIKSWWSTFHMAEQTWVLTLCPKLPSL